MILLPIVVLGVGYALRPEPQVIEQRSDVQVAIQVYSDQAQALQPTLHAFQRAWEKANSEQTAKGFVRVIATDTLPALRTLAEELERIACNTPELRTIHQKLVLGYDAVLTPMKTLSETQEREDIERLHKEVVQHLMHLLQTNRLYQKEIEGYYTQHQVSPAPDMTSTPSPAAKPDADSNSNTGSAGHLKKDEGVIP